jgi:hypothetical protein
MHRRLACRRVPHCMLVRRCGGAHYGRAGGDDSPSTGVGPAWQGVARAVGAGLAGQARRQACRQPRGLATVPVQVAPGLSTGPRPSNWACAAAAAPRAGSLGSKAAPLQCSGSCGGCRPGSRNPTRVRAWNRLPLVTQWLAQVCLAYRAERLAAPVTLAAVGLCEAVAHAPEQLLCTRRHDGTIH